MSGVFSQPRLIVISEVKMHKDGGKVSEIGEFGISSFSGHAIDPCKIHVPMTLTIDMTALDEICERAQGFKEIVLNVDGKMHHYKTEDVLEILREIELD